MTSKSKMSAEIYYLDITVKDDQKCDTINLNTYMKGKRCFLQSEQSIKRSENVFRNK